MAVLRTIQPLYQTIQDPQIREAVGPLHEQVQSAVRIMNDAITVTPVQGRVRLTGSLDVPDIGYNPQTRSTFAAQGEMIRYQNRLFIKMGANKEEWSTDWYELLSAGGGATGSVIAGAGLSGGGPISTDPVLLVNQGYQFNWTNTHDWEPSAADREAIRLYPNSGQTANVLEMYDLTGTLQNVVDERNRLGLNSGSDNLTARLTIKASAGGTEADVLALSPELWFDASDPLDNGGDTSSLSNGDELPTWHDKSGNNRDLTEILAAGPRWWDSSGGAGEEPATLPNSKPVVRTKNGVASAYTLATALTISTDWTCFIVKMSSASLGVDMGSDEQTSGYGAQYHGHPTISSPGPDHGIYYEKTSGAQTLGEVLFTPDASESNGTYYLYTMEREAGNDHNAWMDDIALTRNSQIGAFGNPYRIYYLAQYDTLSVTPQEFDYIYAEVILFGYELTPEQRQTVWNYLGSKYNITSIVSAGAGDTVLEVWDTDGNVDSIIDAGLDWGIGTETPASKVHVYQAADPVTLTVETDGTEQATLVLDGAATGANVASEIDMRAAGATILSQKVYPSGEVTMTDDAGDVFWHYYPDNYPNPPLWVYPTIEYFEDYPGGNLIIQGASGRIEVGSKEFHGGDDSLYSTAGIKNMIFDANTVGEPNWGAPPPFTDTRAAFEFRYDPESGRGPLYLLAVRDSTAVAYRWGVSFSGRVGLLDGLNLRDASFTSYCTMQDQDEGVEGIWTFENRLIVTGGLFFGIDTIDATYGSGNHYSIVLTDRVIQCATAAGDVYVDLPGVITNSLGFQVTVKNDGGGNSVFLYNAGGDTIEGTDYSVTPLELIDTESVNLLSDGISDWFAA